MADIKMKYGESIGGFIERVVRPDQAFLRETGDVIDDIVKALQQQSDVFRIKEIIKGGSLGKGTAIKGKSDIDLLVVINNYNVQNLQKAITDGKLLTKIGKMFEKAVEKGGAQCNFSCKTQFSVQFQLKTPGCGEWHDVDILPIADLDVTYGKQRIYEEMKRSSSGEREFYSGSLVRLQIEFVKHRSPKLKDVIRFCKYWKKETQLNIPSYAIELIAIKVWEDQGSPDSKSLKDLITAVFTTMMQFRHLAVAWYANYNSSLCEPMATPYIRDPANPFKNVLQYPENFYRIETQAGQMRATIR